MILHVYADNHVMLFSFALCLLADVRKYLVGQSACCIESACCWDGATRRSLMPFPCRVDSMLSTICGIKYQYRNDSCEEAHIILRKQLYRLLTGFIS